ncbi:hypothetical protein [Pseudobutyrivibrio sp. LB2011]|uniref:hypothetical protein n=1 Tax=Pseudobutyrivibrio sp. LB2011 TaxID=1408312 RepID=UPI0005D1DC71|nr:hypothetical protein [Pseudobutyrivibrio sp. LB2011]
MTTKISPFTMTPGIAGNALIETHYADEIIANFESEESFKYVYKIVGLRGSGKSVEYSLVMNYFRDKKNWLVYSLSAGGNPTQTLLSLLSKESFINDKSISKSIGATASVGGDIVLMSANGSANTSITVKDNENFYSDEAALQEMIEESQKSNYKILIGIDDIAKSDEMVRFLSILGTIMMKPDVNVRFICTGLSKNIEDFVNVPHLSFFVRNEAVKMKPLDYHSIARKYRQLLVVPQEDAINLAKFTKGYAYAYQVLGEICFKLKKSIIDEEIKHEFDDIIGSQYDLLWDSLTEAEQQLVKIILNTESGQVSEIKKKMEKESGYTSLRDRLMKKHMLITQSRGTVSVPLPRFKEYVDNWH